MKQLQITTDPARKRSRPPGGAWIETAEYNGQYSVIRVAPPRGRVD